MSDISDCIIKILADNGVSVEQKELWGFAGKAENVIQLDFSEHDKRLIDEIMQLKERIADLENENKNLNIRIFLNEAYGDKKSKINLNDRIKVKLTPLGVKIYYHQHDELNKKIKENGGTQLEPRMPEIDKDGFTEFTLWHFMELYGEHIGMCKPNVIEPLNIVVAE